MQAYLGHIIATLVFVVLAGVLFTVRQRSELQGADQAARYGATVRTLDLARMLEYDLDNMINPDLVSVSCSGDGRSTRTLTFPTLDPVTFEDVTVNYMLTESGTSTPYDGADSPLYAVRRAVAYADGRTEEAAGPAELAAFDVSLVSVDRTTADCRASGSQSAPDRLDAIRVRFVTAQRNLVTQFASDQRNPDAFTFNQVGFTVRPPNLDRN